MKLEKIDGIMLWFALHSRKYMLDMVNRGITHDYFGTAVGSEADIIFKSLRDLFLDPTINNVVSPTGFIDYCNRVGKTETAISAKTLFDRIANLNPVESDYGLYLKEFKDRYAAEIANENLKKIQDLLATGTTDSKQINTMYENAWKEIARLNRTEVFDEGILADDMANMRQEYLAVESDPEGFRGVTVGIPSLDNKTNGFQPSELIIIAGMEGTGKSLVMMNMAMNAWLGPNRPGRAIHGGGRNVLYFTLEMPRSNKGKAGTGAYLNRRIMSCLSEVPFSGMRKGNLSQGQKEKLMSSFDFVTNYKKHNQFIVVDIPRGATVKDIELKFEEWNEKYPIDLVVVDYMGIMSGSSTGKGDDADWQAQGQIAAGLHEFARTYRVPVLTGAQVNRPQGKNNSLKDQNYNTTRIARSAQITQNANIVMQIGCRDQEENYSDMPIYITKMRDSDKGVLTLTKAFDLMRIYDGAPSAASELDMFESAPPNTVPLSEVEYLEDDEVGPSSSPVLDFGDDDDDDTEYNELDF